MPKASSLPSVMSGSACSISDGVPVSVRPVGSALQPPTVAGLHSIWLPLLSR